MNLCRLHNEWVRLLTFLITYLFSVYYYRIGVHLAVRKSESVCLFQNQSLSNATGHIKFYKSLAISGAWFSVFDDVIWRLSEPNEELECELVCDNSSSYTILKDLNFAWFETLIICSLSHLQTPCNVSIFPHKKLIDDMVCRAKLSILSCLTSIMRFFSSISPSLFFICSSSSSIFHSIYSKTLKCHYLYHGNELDNLWLILMNKSETPGM